MSAPRPPLYLVGLRGAGKSTAGARLATRRGVPWVDTDAEIVRRAGATVAQIFAARGEAEFRRRERALMLELLDGGAEQVVATGGGCVLDPEVHGRLCAAPAVVWLDAELSLLGKRVRGAPGVRPSLTGGDPVLELGELRAAREALYRRCARRRIDTSGLNPDEVADVLEQLWADLPPHDLR